MADNVALEKFQWSFTIKDYKDFEGAEIAVYSNSYKGALAKIKKLKLPTLNTYEDIQEGLKFVGVYEINPFDDEDNVEFVVDSEDNE